MNLEDAPTLKEKFQHWLRFSSHLLKVSQAPLAGDLPASGPLGTAASCCPLSMGHVSGKAVAACYGLITLITGVPWVRTSQRSLYYGSLICFSLS